MNDHANNNFTKNRKERSTFRGPLSSDGGAVQRRCRHAFSASLLEILECLIASSSAACLPPVPPPPIRKRIDKNNDIVLLNQLEC